MMLRNFIVVNSMESIPSSLSFSLTINCLFKYYFHLYIILITFEVDKVETCSVNRLTAVYANLRTA